MLACRWPMVMPCHAAPLLACRPVAERWWQPAFHLHTIIVLWNSALPGGKAILKKMPPAHLHKVEQHAAKLGGGAPRLQAAPLRKRGQRAEQREVLQGWGTKRLCTAAKNQLQCCATLWCKLDAGNVKLRVSPAVCSPRLTPPFAPHRTCHHTPCTKWVRFSGSSVPVSTITRRPVG